MSEDARSGWVRWERSRLLPGEGHELAATAQSLRRFVAAAHSLDSDRIWSRIEPGLSHGGNPAPTDGERLE